MSARASYGPRQLLALAVIAGAIFAVVAIQPQATSASTLCDQVGQDNCSEYCHASTPAFTPCDTTYSDIEPAAAPFGNQASQGAVGTGPSTCVHDYFWTGSGWDSYYRTCNNGYVDDGWNLESVTESGLYALAVGGNNDSSTHTVTAKVPLVPEP